MRVECQACRKCPQHDGSSTGHDDHCYHTAPLRA